MDSGQYDGMDSEEFLRTITAALEAKNIPGGTAPARVREALETARSRLASLEG